MLRPSRRLAVRWLALSATSLGLMLAGTVPAATPAAAQVDEVKVALIAPLSGPWARQGELKRMGAEMAIDDINNSGGIKALGGAKMRLVVADAGDSAEKAKNAAQRLVSQHPDLIGGTGSWLSSFTLAVTEVTERAGIPWLTLSYSDKITDRGFKYVFQTSPTGNAQSTGALPALMELAQSQTGERPKTLGLIMDNTAAPVSFATPMREGDLVQKLGLKMLVEEVFTPPLSDATPMVQKLRSSRPDILVLLASNIPDDKLLLEKISEFGLGQGRMPVIANGAHIAVPELLNTIADPQLLEGLMSIVANWGAKGQEELIKRFVERTGEPWMTQDSISTYGDMMLFRWALEEVGEVNREKVAEALHRIDTTEGPALYFPGERLSFEPNGRRAGAPLVIVQWQGGRVETIYPPGSATAEPIWPKQ